MLAIIRSSISSFCLLSGNVNAKIYKTIILPVVLYRCETWSLTLRKERRLRVFENRVLRKIFGSKRNEVTEGWRKLHNEELHIFNSSSYIIRQINSRRMSKVGHVARMTEEKKVYKVLAGKPEGKRPLGGERHRREDGVRMDLKGDLLGVGEWIQLAQDTVRCL
jgi:hypothetical protein